MDKLKFCTGVSLKMVVFWDAAPCSPVDTDQHIVLTTEAVSTPEMLVNVYQIMQCNIPEDSHLHTHHHENLKYHLELVYLEYDRRTTAILHHSKIKHNYS
jgi:hypothetical protein